MSGAPQNQSLPLAPESLYPAAYTMSWGPLQPVSNLLGPKKVCIGPKKLTLRPITPFEPLSACLRALTTYLEAL